jgi:hypothetical protein
MPVRHFRLLLEPKNPGLHLFCVRDLFAMPKQFNWTARLILAALIASLVSCQSGGAGASNGGVTDPNVSFSNPSTREH